MQIIASKLHRVSIYNLYARAFESAKSINFTFSPEFGFPFFLSAVMVESWKHVELADISMNTWDELIR